MWIAMLAVAAVHSCVAVDGDQILMSDLALADARFSAAPAGQSAGYAPQPGAKRVFWPNELIHLADRNGISISAPFEQICFELRTRLISPDEVTTAVRVWAPEPAHIEVLEQSRFQSPAGTLVFERPQILREGKDGSMFLHGYVLFRATQRFPVWARVRVSVMRDVVVATNEMNAGSEVLAEQLKSEQREMGMASSGLATSVAELAGRLAKTHIAAQTPLLLAQFEKGNDVIGGATVKAEVRVGAALLSFDARAQSNGRVGDVVPVMNPANSRIFKAKVVGKNSVLAEVSRK